MEADWDEYVHTMPVPFGRKVKRLMTESTSVVTGEELQKHPITVLQNAFTSTVNGVETYECPVNRDGRRRPCISAVSAP